jgi:hypothetical protein
MVFPLTVALLDAEMKRLGIVQRPDDEPLIDHALLNQCEDNMLGTPALNTDDGEGQSLWARVLTKERRNTTYESQGLPRRPYMIALVTDDPSAATACARDVARRLFRERTSNTPASLFGLSDGFYDLQLSPPPAPNLAGPDLFRNHSFVLLSEAPRPTKGSTPGAPSVPAALPAFFAPYMSFSKIKGDLVVPVWHGTRKQVKHLLEMVEAGETLAGDGRGR